MLQSPLIHVLMAMLPQEKIIMGSVLRGLTNGLGSTVGVSMAAIFVEKRQEVHALAFSEDQSGYAIGTAETLSAAQEHLHTGRRMGSSAHQGSVFSPRDHVR